MNKWKFKKKGRERKDSLLTYFFPSEKRRKTQGADWHLLPGHHPWCTSTSLWMFFLTVQLSPLQSSRYSIYKIYNHPLAAPYVISILMEQGERCTYSYWWNKSEETLLSITREVLLSQNNVLQSSDSTGKPISFWDHQRSWWELGLVVHAYNVVPMRGRQENPMFKAGLSYILSMKPNLDLQENLCQTCNPSFPPQKTKVKTL